MKNAFLLGLEEKGLEICHTILDSGTPSDKEEAILFIADYSFSKILVKQSNNEVDGVDLRRSVTFYNKYLNEYPSGKYSKIVQLRLSFINDYFEFQKVYDRILRGAVVENYIIRQKFKYMFEVLFTYSQPNRYKIFVDSEVEQNTHELLINYLDEIIVNYPNYEPTAMYLKILAKLQSLTNIEYFSSNYLPYEHKFISKKKKYNPKKHISFFTKEYLDAKQELTTLLDSITAKYPTENLVLDLHLIFAEAFLTKNDDDEISRETLEHLEYILKNDEDKLSMRYLMTKEYLLNNKFEISGDNKKTK